MESVLLVLVKGTAGFLWGGVVVKSKQTSVKYCMNFLNDQTVPRLHDHQYNFKTDTLNLTELEKNMDIKPPLLHLLLPKSI